MRLHDLSTNLPWDGDYDIDFVESFDMCNHVDPGWCTLACHDWDGKEKKWMSDDVHILGMM